MNDRKDGEKNIEKDKNEERNAHKVHYGTVDWQQKCDKTSEEEQKRSM
jgi:hypothetical protein